jgi:hypothetical protein
MNENAQIVRHKGCNVAEWNKAVIRKNSVKDGKLMLDDIYPLIFIHFNGTTIRAIADGDEPSLKNYLTRYLNNLKKYKANAQVGQLYAMPSLLERVKYFIWKVATKVSL